MGSKSWLKPQDPLIGHLSLITLGALAPAIAIEHAEISDADWAKQTASRATLDSLRLLNVDLTGARLRESGLTDLVIEGGQFSGLDLTGSVLRRIRLSKARLSGLIAADAELKDVVFTHAKLDLANWRFAKLSRIEFIHCNLAEADFAGTELTQVKFINCELTRADFSNAKLKQVDLRTSEISDIRGIQGLAGATINTEQLMLLAPGLAQTLGLEVD